MASPKYVVTCKYCDSTFTGATADSNYNRHLKQKSQKPPEKRGAHPEANTLAFRAIAKERSFHEKLKTNELRLQKKSKSHHDWYEKTLEDSKKRVQEEMERLR
jgi:hypothetical protein